MWYSSSVVFTFAYYSVVCVYCGIFNSWWTGVCVCWESLTSLHLMSVNSSVHPLEKTLLVSVSLGKISRSAIDENMANSFVVWKILLNFSLLTVVLFCFPIHQYIKVPVLLWSYQQNMLSNFWTFANLRNEKFIFNCTSLMSKV